MSLPASGQISLNDMRTEMGQTSYTDYTFGLVASSPWNGNGLYYAPINLNNCPDGCLFPTSTPMSFSQFYSYNHNAYHAPSDTFIPMYLNNVLNVCYSSTMNVFDLGTSNKTYDITISGSAADFTGIDYVRVFYGQPWNSSGTNTGSYAPVYEVYVNQSAYNNTFNYSYTYDSGRGQKLYIVATAGCY